MQRLMCLNLEIAGARIGIDLKLFDLLAQDTPMTIKLLSEKTGADTVLLRRICRYLASIGMIKQSSKDTFTATNITQTLAHPGNQAGIHHYFDTAGPQYQALPDFLAETKYQNPTDNTKSCFHKAFPDAGSVPVFIWFMNNPVRFGYFNQWMATQRSGMPTWLDVYPIAKETKDRDPKSPLFVDVGGGFGHQCIALKSKFPKLEGRIILQDLPPALEHAIPHDGVEPLVHNFFEPQPIKGAKYYYLRNILHDYPDAQAVKILENLKEVMSADSAILIDEMVLPDTRVHWQAAQLDLTMMAALGAMERSQEQWHALLKSAGLKIRQVYTYTESLNDSVIVAIPV